jgi:DNA-binding MarR family transcriptional regulator
MESGQDAARDLVLLEEIERNPDTTQATLAARLGVAVGTVNWHVKRLIAKGYVKVKRAERRKLRYIITPEGISLRAGLTVAYIGNSMALYRDTRQQSLRILQAVREQERVSVFVDGDSEIAEVFRLTCLEQGILMATEPGANVAIVEIRGRSIGLRGVGKGPVSEVGGEASTARMHGAAGSGS